MTRRMLLGIVALTMIIGLVPGISQASCYPVPDPSCPPGTIKVTQKIPTLPRLGQFPSGFPGDPHSAVNPLIAAANSAIDTVNTAITQTNNAIAQFPGIANPVYGVWPEMQMAVTP